MASESLSARGVWKAYQGEPVLRGLDVSVAPGEIYGLFGPNGSGKSTVINAVTGLLPIDRGEVRIAGQPLSRMAPGQVGYVPQEPALYPRLSCAETLRFFGRIHGVHGEALRARVEIAIDATGLEPYRDARAGTLSGGWRQRVNVAVAIVHEPALLVLDEPMTGLDVEARYSLWRLLESLAEQGTAVLLASHGLAEAELHCHRIGILDEGQIVAEGSPEALRRLVPARSIAEICVAESEGLLARGLERTWDVRPRGSRWLRYLPRETTLTSLARELEGLSVTALSVRPVTLEDVFLEVTCAPPLGGATEADDVGANPSLGS